MKPVPRPRSRITVLVLLLGLIAFFVWTTDRFTLQGERTVYTADCLHGAWVGNHCGGQLSAGPRFRYRALKAHREVLFWIMGTNEPSSRLTSCSIQDGRNWSCPLSDDAPKSMTLALSHGKPMAKPQGPAPQLRPVSKVRWMLLKAGLKLPVES